MRRMIPRAPRPASGGAFFVRAPRLYLGAWVSCGFFGFLPVAGGDDRAVAAPGPGPRLARIPSYG